MQAMYDDVKELKELFQKPVWTQEAIVKCLDDFLKDLEAYANAWGGSYMDDDE